MNRLVQGAPGGVIDSEDEEHIPEASDGDDDGDAEEESEAGFFSGEGDLEEIAVEGGADEEDGEDLMSEGDSYGEMEEDSDQFEKESEGEDLP